MRFVLASALTLAMFMAASPPNHPQHHDSTAIAQASSDALQASGLVPFDLAALEASYSAPSAAPLAALPADLIAEPASPEVLAVRHRCNARRIAFLSFRPQTPMRLDEIDEVRDVEVIARG